MLAFLTLVRFVPGAVAFLVVFARVRRHRVSTRANCCYSSFSVYCYRSARADESADPHAYGHAAVRRPRLTPASPRSAAALKALFIYENNNKSHDFKLELYGFYWFTVHEGLTRPTDTNAHAGTGAGWLTMGSMAAAPMLALPSHASVHCRVGSGGSQQGFFSPWVEGNFQDQRLRLHASDHEVA